jgi:predicted phage tail protein
MNAPLILGSKKKKGSASGGSASSAASTSMANTLRSRARARLLELISEGPIEGLVAGPKSIYFDQTPVQAQDNSYNFNNVEWEQHYGLADEGWFNGNSTVETPVSVETQVKISSGPVVRTVSTGNADAVRVMVRIPSLYRIDDNGSVKATSLSYAIDVQPNGGVYSTALTVNIDNEKTSSPYQRAHRIPLPQNGAPWNIRVRRITADSTEDKLQNDLFWESYTILVEGKFIYPHSAIVSLEVNAEDMGSSIPSRFFHVKGLKVQVPSNYNPTSRVYTGTWNGTFNVAWTNNPAWIFYDLITNNRYGLGEFIDSTKVDKWALYTIAQYCDELVPTGFKDGNGDPTYEPRYTFNGVINTREEAFTVLRQIATAWRGMSYWAAGQVFPTADMPEDPVKLVTPANVIDGRFEYSSSSLKSRHSVAIVQWNDPDDFYKPAVEVVIDDEMLKKFGWREKGVAYVGCTSRGLARRYGKWLLDVEKNETETVTYTASFDHADARPGKIIQVSDPAKSQIRLGGRLKGITTTGVKLDAPFLPEDGVTYSIIMILSDGSTLVTKEIASFGDPYTGFDGALKGYESATFTTAFGGSDPLPIVQSMYVLTSPDKLPREYRVISVREQEGNKFQIVALQHDPLKYARIEQGIEFDTPSFIRPVASVNKPTNLTASESVYIVDGRQRSVVNLSWSRASALTRGYRVAMISPDEGLVQLGETLDLSIDIRNLNPGAFTFYVYAIGPTGQLSQPSELNFTVNGWSSTDSPVVSSVQLIDRPGSSQFVGRNVHIKWTNTLPSGTDLTSTELNPLYKHNEVKVYDSATNSLLRTEIIRANEYIYTYDKNIGDNLAYTRGPSRGVKFEVRLFDNAGRTSTTVTTTFTNSRPAAVTPTITVNQKDLLIEYAKPADPDFDGVRIWVSTVNGFDPNANAPVYEGSDTSWLFKGQPLTTYYVRMATYDAFDKTSLNISAQITVTTSAIGSGDILDNAITNSKLGANVVDSAKIANNSVIAGKIAANVISARELLVYNFENLVPDNQFLTPAAWNTNGGPWAVQATATVNYRTPGVGRYIHAGGSGYTVGFQSQFFAVEAGKQYQCGHIQHKIGSLGETIGRIVWFNNQYALLSYSDYYSGTVAAAFEERFGVVTAPANAAFAYIEFYVQRTNTNGDIFFSYPYCFRRKDANLIVDGAITADKVAANAITADKVAANAITAAKIAAGTITGDKIAAGTINADRIQAGTITANQIVAAGITQLYATAAAGTAQTTGTGWVPYGNGLAFNVPANAGLLVQVSTTGTFGNPNNGNCQFGIFQDGGQISSIGRLSPAVGGAASSGHQHVVTYPAAGVHTYQMYFRSSGGNTATITENWLSAIMFYR